MLTKEETSATAAKFGSGLKDTGNARVQVALLTQRINGLMDHFKQSPKDHASRRGLLKMVGHRRRLLTYLRRTEPARYVELIKELKLRK